MNEIDKPRDSNDEAYHAGFVTRFSRDEINDEARVLQRGGRPPLDPVHGAMTGAERMRRCRANLSKAAKARRRIQRRHAYAEKNEDAYFTCPQAVISLLHLERQYLPRTLLEPCAGDGAISRLLERAGYDVTTFDIRDYGLPGCQLGDYLKLAPPPGIEGVVTNPPYVRARQFLEKALADGNRYVALLVRTNFLFEGAGRTELLEIKHPPTRVWLTDNRLPMMHRAGWTGKSTASNTPYAWAVWDQRANQREFPRRFNWREICALPEWEDWLPYASAGATSRRTVAA